VGRCGKSGLFLRGVAFCGGDLEVASVWFCVDDKYVGIGKVTEKNILFSFTERIEFT